MPAGKNNNTPRHPSEQDKECLLQAIRSGSYDDALSYVDRFESAIDEAVYYDWTPLTLAAWIGRKDMAKLFLERGASVDKKGGQGRTALSLAASQGYVLLAELLLEKGASTEVLDYNRKTARDLADHFGHVSVVTLIDRYEEDRKRNRHRTETRDRAEGILQKLKGQKPGKRELKKPPSWKGGP